MLFQSIAEEVVLASVKRARADARSESGSAVERILDMLSDRQGDVLTGELHTRWPSSMSGDPGQRIYPVVVPLLQRFVEEQATLFVRPAHWYYADKEGQETDATKAVSRKMQDHLADCGFHETFAQLEVMAVAFHPAPVGLWSQIDYGEYSPALVMPQRIYPVHPEGAQINEAEPRSYDGFIIQLGGKSDNPHSKPQSKCAFITGAETIIYEGEPDHVRGEQEPIPNPAKWMQADKTGVEKMLPLCPLTFWHWARPMGQLLPPPGTDLMTATIEASLAVTMIFDYVKGQGFSIPWTATSSPDETKSQRAHGWRFPMNLRAGETAGYINAGVNFDDLFSLPMSYVKLVAMLKRMSANDFSIDGAPPTSGFAKLVDSLPKLESRDRAKQRWERLVRRLAGPQITAHLIALGVLDESARQLSMRIKFADITFPEQPAERNTRLQFDLDNGLTTPARILAEREGIAEEEAQERIDQAQEAAMERAQKAQAAMGGPEPDPEDADADDDPLARMIGRPKAKKKAKAEARE